MTACKDSLSGKKAVSATLAGVLAVGMVPAAAFAADQPADATSEEGIDLLDTTSGATLFSNGTISITSTDISAKAAKANEFTAQAKENQSALGLTEVKVTPQGEQSSAAVTATTDGDTYIYEITKDGKAVTSIVDPGTYTLTVKALKGQYKNGVVTATITVAGASLEGAEICEIDADNPTVGSDHDMMYTGEELNLGVSKNDGAPLKAGTDYELKVVKAGDDAINDPAVEVKNAGDYYAVITGKGKYEGSVVTDSFTVQKFDLAKANITVDDVIGKTAAKPTVPSTAAVAESDIAASGTDVEYNAKLANTSELKMTLSSGTWNKAGEYEFTVAPATEDDPNFKGTGTATCKKVDAAATFQYNEGDWEDSFATNLGDKKPVKFDCNKITALDADGEAVAAPFSVAYDILDKDGQSVKDQFADGIIDEAGTYTVVATIEEAEPTQPATAKTYALGGTAKCTVTVKAATVASDAKVVVKYNDEVVTSVEDDYAPNMSIDTDDFDVAVLDKNNNALDSNLYDVDIYDADGKKIDAIEGAGSYTLKVTSDKIDITGDASVAITIKALDLTDVKIADATNNSDGLVNQTGYSYVKENENSTLSALSLIKYQGKDVNKDGKKTDEDYNAVPSSVNVDWYKLDAKSGEYKLVKPAEAKIVAGDYKAVLTADKGDEANYKFAGEGETVVEFTVADENDCAFGDVAPSAWFFAEVAKAHTNQYVFGIGDTGFYAPYESMSRGQVAIVLMRMAGGDADPDGKTYDTPFTDVASDAYYAKAVQWASDAGIVTGFDGTGEFRPNDPVTREQFATMLARYAKLKGAYTEAATSVLADYADAANVSDWAKGYVAWAVSNKVMGQNTTVLNPTGEVSRAEVAAMAVRYQPEALA